MTFARNSLLSALAIALASIAVIPGTTSRSFAQAAPAAAAPAPRALAVVNIVQLFSDLTEKKAADSDLDKMKRSFEAESNAKQAEIEQMQKTLAALNANSKDYRDRQDELLKKTMELQSFNQFAQEKVFLELRLRTADLYRKINDAIATYAQANGIALVFVADNLNVDNARSQEQLQAMVTVRKLLYYHQSFDITNAIRQKMNSDYELSAPNK